MSLPGDCDECTRLESVTVACFPTRKVVFEGCDVVGTDEGSLAFARIQVALIVSNRRPFSERISLRVE